MGSKHKCCFVKFHRFERPDTHVDPCRVDVFRKHDHEGYHDDDARPEGESSAKRQRTSEKGTYAVGESSSQAMEESTPSGSGTQEQQEFDAWSNDQGTYDDEVPSKEVSLELFAEMSGKGMKWVSTTNDQKRMQDALNDMMRSRCDSGEEHQYHLDQIKIYKESQIYSLGK
nr:hypothetical protein [Tanacetum cinerariifolium]